MAPSTKTAAATTATARRSRAGRASSGRSSWSAANGAGASPSLSMTSAARQGKGGFVDVGALLLLVEPAVEVLRAWRQCWRRHRRGRGGLRTGRGRRRRRRGCGRWRGRRGSLRMSREVGFVLRPERLVVLDAIEIALRQVGGLQQLFKHRVAAQLVDRLLGLGGGVVGGHGDAQLGRVLPHQLGVDQIVRRLLLSHLKALLVERELAGER